MNEPEAGREKVVQNELRIVSSNADRSALAYRIGIGISLGALALLALHVSSPSLRLDAIGLALVILAMLPWLVPFLQNYLQSARIFGQEFIFLRGKVEEQGKEIQNQKEIIQNIYEALRRSLTKYEFQHLVELESSTPSPHFQYSDFLRDEMIRLCQHGYAAETFDCSTWKMNEKGDARFDLKEFYRITDEGKEHLALLRDLQASIASYSDTR